MLHYGRYASNTPAGLESIAGRAKAAHELSFRRSMAARMAKVADAAKAAASTAASTAQSAVVAASTASAAATSAATAAVTSVATTPLRHLRATGGGALSSEAATQRVLEQAGLHLADMNDVAGLGEVTTAEAFHAALPAGEAVWLTFSNAAYLHFAQNWYMSVKAIGRQRQVVVAALDPQTLKAWRSLRVPVLDYAHFG